MSLSNIKYFSVYDGLMWSNVEQQNPTSNYDTHLVLSSHYHVTFTYGKTLEGSSTPLQ